MSDEWQGSAHALAELPYHQTRSERWDELFATLTDFTYLEQKAKRVAVVRSGEEVSAYNGVLALIDDYERALAAFPSAGCSVIDVPAARSDQRRVLEAFGKVTRREAHKLTELPDLLWQQMYNRLQWSDGPAKDGAVSQVLAPELEDRSKPGAGPWLRLVTQLRESGALIRTLSGHTGSVLAVACSPDGTRIVSGSSDDTVRVWDATSGEEVAILAGHRNLVFAVAYFPDGARIVSGSGDNTLKIWDAATGALLATLAGHADTVQAAACSPDGTRIVSASWDKTLKVWDAVTDAELATLSGHTGRVMAVAWSPDGTHVVSGSQDTTLKVWDAATGAETTTLSGHTRMVTALAYSRDGTRIVSGAAGEGLKLWDAASGAELATFTGHIGSVSGVAYSPDGTRILCALEDLTIKVVDAASGAELADASPATPTMYRPSPARRTARGWSPARSITR